MRAVLAAVAAVSAATLLGWSAPARAHGMRSAYLEITETGEGRAAVVVRGQVPVTGLELEVAPPCEISEQVEVGHLLRCPRQLRGAVLTVRGMGPIVSESIVHVTFQDGSSTSACVTAAHPTWTLPDDAAGPAAVAARYVRLGVEHIAAGYDHLMFLLALVLCLRRVRAVLLAETAFTLSHTLSFSASALGWIKVSASAAEACIALSLLLLALDLEGPRGLPPRDARKTAGLAFAFGLVHGLGFAGGLREMGLPGQEVPAALAGFAVGVELGQVAFLALALAAVAALTRAPRLSRGVTRIAALAIGAVGWFWLLARLRALS